MGSGMLKDVKTLTETRTRLSSLLKILESNRLLILKDFCHNECVEMHDLTREASMSIVKEKRKVLSFRNKEEPLKWPENDELERCNILFLPGSKVEGLECTILEMLLLNLGQDHSDEWEEILHYLVEKMKELKVVDLTRFCFLRSIPSLDSLTKIRTLCLHQCVLGDISPVGKLKDLEILAYRNVKSNSCLKK